MTTPLSRYPIWSRAREESSVSRWQQQEKRQLLAHFVALAFLDWLIQSEKQQRFEAAVFQAVFLGVGGAGGTLVPPEQKSDDKHEAVFLGTGPLRLLSEASGCGGNLLAPQSADELPLQAAFDNDT